MVDKNRNETRFEKKNDSKKATLYQRPCKCYNTIMFYYFYTFFHFEIELIMGKLNVNALSIADNYFIISYE